MARLIDADALERMIMALPDDELCEDCCYTMVNAIGDAPTVATDNNVLSKWISVKDKLPEEHPSMFYKLYGTEKWAGAMWRTESDRVLVTIKFPDGTRTVDKGKLQDGAWRTGVSPVLPQEVTHWALWPEPPKEDL